MARRFPTQLFGPGGRERGFVSKLVTSIRLIRKKRFTCQEGEEGGWVDDELWLGRPPLGYELGWAYKRRLTWVVVS